MRTAVSCAVAALTVVWLSVTVFAVPLLLSYQANVDISGSPFSGTGYFRFAIVNDGATQYYWSNDGNTPPLTDCELLVSNGLFQVILGNAMQPISQSIFNQDVLYLRVWFDDGVHGSQLLSPDVRITSNAFAFKSGNAELLSGQAYNSNWPTTLTNIQNACSNNYHLIGGVDDDTPDNDSEVPDNISVNNGLIYAPSGGAGVGIGTSSPQVKLSLGTDLTEKKLAIWDGVGDFYGFGSPFGRLAVFTNNSEKMSILGDGKVGIGITAPGYRLHIEGGDVKIGNSAGDNRKIYFGDGSYLWIGENADDHFEVYARQGSSLMGGALGVGTLIPQQFCHFYRVDADGPTAIRLENQGDVYYDITADNNMLSFSSMTHADTLVLKAGAVGIGTTSPGANLEVEGASGAITLIKIDQTGSKAYSGYRLDRSNTETWLIGMNHIDDKLRFRRSASSDDLVIDTAGKVGIGTTSPTEKLDVNGVAKCTVLKISGGSDLAEPFDIVEKDAIEPGMIVSIDAENPGKLKISDREYDCCVAGVVSGAGGIEPGMIMGQAGSVADGEYPVALTGRVFCFADATSGAIAPGDLLTTSQIPGHAMRVQDRVRSQGAVLGKAMSSLDKGKGLVLVLVSLQ